MSDPTWPNGAPVEIGQQVRIVSQPISYPIESVEWNDHGLTWVRLAGTRTWYSLSTVEPIDLPSPLIVDEDSGSRYYSWTDGHAIGYRVEHQDGTTEFIYLNASGGSDDGTPTVTLYQGPVGDPSQDPAWHHYDLNERTEP